MIGNQWQQILQEETVQPYLFKARFGVEREAQRVTLTGELAKTPHPKTLGSRSIHSTIQTDFSETQIEFITPVFETTKECVKCLNALHDVGIRSMEETELLWAASMPPVLPEKSEEIQIARLEEEEVLYREHLATVYGKRKQMLSGIHFNFEFGKELLEQMFLTSSFESLSAMKQEMYMKLARQYLRYQWFITYLFGATPKSYGYLDKKVDALTKKVRSLRNSDFGYKNDAKVRVRYTSLADYLADIDALVKSGSLIDAKEYYSPIRLRGGGKVRALKENGIRYVELRNLDIDPFSRIGLTQEMLDFLHIYCLFLVWKDEEDLSLEKAEEKNHAVALENALEQTHFYDEGKDFFVAFKQFAKQLRLPASLQKIILDFEQLLDEPTLTPSGRLSLAEEKEKEAILNLSKKHAQKGRERAFQLAGYENMELSTQNLLFDALQLGLEVKVLDEVDQFVALTFQGQTEIVQNGNMTSKDQLIHYGLLDNKIVTKQLLKEGGFSVPHGEHFSEKRQAKESFRVFSTKRLVVKPKSTNFGLGITIFQIPPEKEAFEQAIDFAFKEDKEILIEEFVEGSEYRFFVIGGETKAVLSRVGAHVTGDGVHCVEQLVEQKNSHPWRGEKNHFPLVAIQLGEIEQLQLKMQGLDKNSVPEKGQKVVLRENSNISTGGDSYDVTEKVHSSYKELAGKIARLFDVQITGIDLMIQDIATPWTDKNVAVIEVNYNPMMSMHLYPYQTYGTPPRLTKEVLKFLFAQLDTREKQ